MRQNRPRRALPVPRRSWLRLLSRTTAGAALLVSAIAAAADPASAARTTERLGTAVVPTSQDIVLDLDPELEDFTGTTRIELRVKERAARFRLHAEGMGIRRASLAAADGTTSEAEVAFVADDLIEIACDPALEPGAWSLELDFAAEYGTRSAGLYRVVEDGRGYLFTQFESDDAREAFPCFDEPEFKIPFRLTMTTPDDVLALSNTGPESERVEGGVRTTAFRRTPPMPAYLVAIAVGPFDTVEIPGMSVPGRVITAAGKGYLAAAAVETTPPVLAALERWFDGRMPYEKVDLVAVPRFWPGAMENAGLITYRESILLLEPGSESASQRRTLVSVTAHELAHQWFGNLVTMRWWDDLWLNESFADWMGRKITDEVYPELRQGLVELQGAQRNLEADARPSTKPIKREVRAGEPLMEGVGLAYAKGQIVLGMLEGWIGPETVRRGVLDYLEEHAWGNAEAADLWRALDEVSGRNVSGAIAGFLEQPGYPLVRVEPLEEGRVRLSQSRFRNEGVEVEDLQWSIPVVLRWSEAGDLRTRSVLLDRESVVVDLEPETHVDWIYPNGGASGCYRWSLPRVQLRALASDASRRLEVAERIEILGNLEALLAAGELDGGAWMEALASMQADEDPQVLGSLEGAAATIRETFVTPELEDAFAAWVRATLGPGLARMGMDLRAGEREGVSMLRPQLFRALADWGADPELRARAHGMAEDYLADPASVDPSLAGMALRIAAIDGDADLFERCRERLEAARTPVDRQRMIAALASFRDPELRQELLAWSLEALQPEEMGGVARTLGDTEEGHEAWFRFVTDNFDVIADRITEEFIAFLPHSAAGCSAERVAIAREFFGDPERAVTGTESALRRVEDQVTDCVRLREREGPSVAAFLREHAETFGKAGVPVGTGGAGPSGG